MRRAANSLLKSLKDQVREVRYSIRAEAASPGSTLPRLAGVDLGPLMAIGSPALRLADGLFEQVETIATGVLKPVTGLDTAFPRVLGDYVARHGAFSVLLYEPYVAMLVAHGVRDMLISEQALDQAGEQFGARHGDIIPRAGDASPEAVVAACAGLTCALIDARPIRKVAYGDAAGARQHFMLSPNIYCGLIVGLATALVTANPALLDDREAVIDSVDSVVDARFARFKRALSGKSPAIDLAYDFASVLPFLP